jgi:predicted acyltransferase
MSTQTNIPHAATAGGVRNQLPTTTSLPKTERLLSLDVFRGVTIASMMLVNNAGDWEHIYAPLEHAEWNGWTFTDTVFPFFLWIVGVAMTLSFAKRVDRGDDRHRLALHVLKRAAIIFGIGLLLNGFPYYDLAHIRIPGVLQRIAVCYLIAGLIFLYTKVRGQVWWLAGCLVVYWLLMTLVPVPGVGPGHLDPENNLSAYLDRLLLPNHLYGRSKTWDPEGTLSTLPAVATVLFGVLTGHLLRSRKTAQEKTAWMFVAGNLLMLGGVFLGNWMPINKKIWTTPYSIFMAGLALVTFATCYWFVDIQGWKKWSRPFAIYGMNAIAVYILAGAVARLTGIIKIGNASLQQVIYRSVFSPLAGPYTASMLYGVAFSFMMFLVAWFMYRRNWFLRF